MLLSEVKIGDRVVRSKGDYVVGRVGTVVDIDNGRVQVDWDGNTKTWVAADCIEPEGIPYTIIYSERNKRTGRRPAPKYMKK